MSAVVMLFPTPSASTLSAETDRPSCAEHDPDWWFDEASFDRAVEVCRTCPVRARCLNEALNAGETLGVWGGLTPAQRAALPAADVLPLRRPTHRRR